MNKKIFIGGTGRSGTSILSQLIGSQIKTCSLSETRFILDKNGLLDLFHSLTDNFSISQGRMALKEFNILMQNYLKDPYNGPYVGFEFDNKFTKNYDTIFNDFFQQLHYGTFYGYDFNTYNSNKVGSIIKKYLKPLKPIYARIKKRYPDKTSNISMFNTLSENMYISKYFNDPNQLLLLMREFVNKLFSEAVRKENKRHWCEDTPANMLHIDFISQLFPEAYFIHITRHPIAVAYSMKKQFWAPTENESIVYFLKGVYDKLVKVKAQATTHNLNFIEIKLEDLVNIKKQEEITDFIGLESNFINKPLIQQNKIDYYKDEISNKDYDYFSNHLSQYINFFNYNE